MLNAAGGGEHSRSNPIFTFSRFFGKGFIERAGPTDPAARPSPAAKTPISTRPSIGTSRSTPAVSSATSRARMSSETRHALSPPDSELAPRCGMRGIDRGWGGASHGVRGAEDPDGAARPPCRCAPDPLRLHSPPESSGPTRSDLLFPLTSSRTRISLRPRSAPHPSDARAAPLELHPRTRSAPPPDRRLPHPPPARRTA